LWRNCSNKDSDKNSLLKTFTSFFPEIAGLLVPASQVAALEDEEPAEVAVVRSVEFAAKHPCDIPGLCLYY
jgi:hypothetical protein